jgi:diguanylate cyclase (GGDEF)-like protein/PAS domain S-box-containing protein
LARRILHSLNDGFARLPGILIPAALERGCQMADNATFDSKEVQRGASLSAKVAAVFAMVGIVALANIAVAHIMVREQNGVAETVSVAGKLRMLSQKIAFEAALAGDNPPAHHARNARLRQACEDYDAALDALASGGKAFGYQVNRPSLALDARLAELRAEWQRFRRDVAQAAAAGGGERAEALEPVAQGSMRLLHHAEDIVRLMTEEARRTQETALQRMHALLFTNLVLLSLAFVIARHRIVLPLRALAQQSRELAAGNYVARPVSASRDEIGQLACAFNHAAHRIGELVERIERDRRELRQAESIFRGLAENSMVGVYIAEDGRFRFVNPKMAELFGHERTEMMTSVSVFDIVPEDARNMVERNIRRRLSGEVREVSYESKACRKDGSLFDIEVFGSTMEIGGKAVTIGVILDISERKRIERLLQAYAERLEYNANHDALTGLANRNLLGDRLHQAIATARRHGNMVAVLLHDLDNFKVINDSLGHAAGDALLTSVARRMTAAVRETDTVARLGGDEFVIVMPDVERPEDAAAVADKVLDALSEPFHIENQDVYVRASIGISLYPRDGADEQALLKNVDLAMYRAKHQGRGRVSFFTEEMNAANRARQQLEAELHRALERQEFILHYQPRLDLCTGRISGVEALLRWQHPKHGTLSPAGFIPLAEETGLIVRIGAWALEEACRQGRQWQQEGFEDIGVAVNLSMRQLQSEGLLALVLGVLEGSGMDPCSLELEITETAVMKDAQAAMHLLRKLKDAGVRLALDDFGTGYSSLDYLRRFPLDSLKIDRSFVAEIQPGAKESSLVSAMIAMAGNLGLNAIAEGVETREQAEFLRAHGCRETQGYYFSRPLPPQAMRELLREHADVRRPQVALQVAG